MKEELELKKNKLLLAKSNGLSLIEHSKIVKEYSLKLFSNIIEEGDIQNQYSDVIRYASLLHDIGKLTINFQKFLNGKKKSPGYKFRHNEIGWAFLSKYLSNDFLGDSHLREMLLNIVYWHHGISNKISKHTDVEILSSLEEESINNMLEYLQECVDMFQINEEIDESVQIKSPLYFPDDNVMANNLFILNLLRSIVVTSDRNVSHINNLEELTDDVINSLMNDYFGSNEFVEIKDTKFDGSDRFELQKSIVEKIEEGSTTLVKAPAGFGKTLIGTMLGFKSNKKIMWVVPRNSIAESLYKSILEEFNNLNINCSIQLILSGEIKETNNTNLKEYESKVIVTNIDNFLAPNIKNDIMDSSSLLFGCTVVFDEFHELVTNSALMSLFVSIMKSRHRLTNSTTLLLSATPIDCFSLWDGLSKKTTILPEKEKHYPSAHNEKYKINCYSEDISIPPNTNSLCIKNTIRDSQIEKSNGNYYLLMHSKFTEEKRKDNFNKLLEGYGKNSELNNSKSNVVGTHMLQASFDISFNSLYENVLSPQSTLQRTGRVNRWGKIKEVCNINIIHKKESTIKNILYNNDLSNVWFKYISKYNGKELNLDELYIIYNSFSNEYSKEIKNYINTVHRESIKGLSYIYPIKFDDNKKINNNKNNVIITAGSNKLRSVVNNNEIFYIVKKENSDSEWVGPFNEIVYNNDFSKEFDERDNIFNSRMIKTIENYLLYDERFDYSDIFNNAKYRKSSNIDNFRIQCKKSNTPYIVYNRYYSEELGVVREGDNFFLNNNDDNDNDSSNDIDLG